MSACEIGWVCEVCREPITDDSGYLTLDYAAALRYEDDTRQWREQHRELHRMLRPDAVAALRDYPERVRWRPLHRKCDPAADSAEAEEWRIAAGRIQTVGDVLMWTAHLLGKTWLPATEWGEVLRAVNGKLGENCRASEVWL
jgi:hypothetical protein